MASSINRDRASERPQLAAAFAVVPTRGHTRAMAGAVFPAVVFSLLGAATLFVGSASASWHAQVFVVGGEPRGWRKPTAPNEESYNHWAARNRFHVGDVLHFKYDKNDSVLVVTRDAYQLCAADKPTLRFEGGDTRFRLDHSGFFYFTSGAPGHCDAGQRMTVRVMVPQQRDGGKPAPAKAPAAMSPGGEDNDEGGTFDPPPGARSSTPGSGAGSSAGSGGSVLRPPPHVAAGADGNKTSAAAGSMRDASSSPLRGRRVLGVVALAALQLLLPA